MNFDITIGIQESNVAHLLQHSIDTELSISDLINSIIAIYYEDDLDEEPDMVDNFLYGSGEPKTIADHKEKSHLDLDLYTEEEVRKLHEILGDDLFN